MIFNIAIGIVVLMIFQFFFIIIRTHFFWKDHRTELPEDLPLVSILIAARNEELFLPKLLDSLEQINYPSERIQFLFANDQSTDLTEKILADWCATHPNCEFITISEQESGKFHSNGKANALAILGEQAKGKILFFTDADCQINPDWIKTGLAAFSPAVGMVIGFTQVQAYDSFGKFQELDWLLTLGLVKVASDLQIQTTGLGNNMAISKSAYLQSGGFKNLPSSLTEDLEISKAIAKADFRIVHQISPGILIRTKQEDSLKKLLNQRKRWFSGVMTLPFFWLVLLSLLFLCLPALILIFFLDPLLGVLLFIIKALLQGMFLKQIRNRANAKDSQFYWLVFDFYFFIINALTILYYFWPSKIRWKSRSYS